MTELHYPIEADKAHRAEAAEASDVRPKAFQDKAHAALTILQTIFVAMPIIAGVDKFFNVLTDWQAYLSEPMRNIVGANAMWAMYAVGVIEIAVGIGVLLRPRIFGYVIALWLLAIVILNLLPGGLYAIALRDLALAFAAVAMAVLAQARRTESRAGRT